MLAAGCGLAALSAAAAAPAGGPEPLPRTAAGASLDLTTRDGLAAVRGRWRYADAKLSGTDFPSPGPDGKPAGPPRATYELTPRPGEASFDQAAWETIDPESLPGRRAGGRVCFNWYRLTATVPETIGRFGVAGSTIVLEIVVDDYAEVWVDGRLERELGQSGGTVIGGFNTPNRVVVARGAEPGQALDIAVFGINGPISAAPPNYIWVRSARLDFHPPDPPAADGAVLRLSPEIDQVVPPGAALEKLAGGFTFTEGPVWLPDGSLLFSEPDRNRIHRWSPDGLVSVYRAPSGYDGADIALYRQPGSNGLTLDGEGRLVICEHGNRRVTRLEKDGSVTVLADRHQGRRLNSPNDIVRASDGALYFSDPPFGLPKGHDDPARELPFSAVFRLKDGRLDPIVTDLAGPNGVALSPDEKHLYVGNWDLGRKVVMRYPLLPGGAVGPGEVFFDATPEPGDQGIDGVKVDAAGNVFVSAPGGIWVVSPQGRRLGVIRGPEPAHNFAFGGSDGRTLYVTARTGLYRIRMEVGGAAPAPAAAGARPVIERLDPRLDRVLAPQATLETIARGHRWVEGPAWNPLEEFLAFSDIPANAIFRWKEGGPASVWIAPSGYSGPAPFPGREPGSNGLLFDRQGRLIVCEHGDRRLARLEPDGARTVLADRYRGRRLNSPNDVAAGADGGLYFTDPPFGLPGTFDDPARELPFSGVYRLTPGGELTLLTSELEAPNGLAFSPDGKTLYVSNASPRRAVWMAFPVRGDGTLGEGRVLADATPLVRPETGLPDGIKVDAAGNLFTAGPGGLHILSPRGERLGLIRFDGPVSNCAWGAPGELYITAGTSVHRLKLAPSPAGSTAAAR